MPTYQVTLHVSTDASIDDVHRHFADQCQAQHEVEIDGGAVAYMLIEAVGVTQEES